MPATAARLVRDYIAARVAAGQALIAELDAYIAQREAEPPKRYGVIVVKDRDGDGVQRDGRKR